MLKVLFSLAAKLIGFIRYLISPERKHEKIESKIDSDYNHQNERIDSATSEPDAGDINIITADIISDDDNTDDSVPEPENVGHLHGGKVPG